MGLQFEWDPNKAATNLVLLTPDVAAAFPDSDAVNKALQLIIQVSKIPVGKPNVAEG